MTPTHFLMNLRLLVITVAVLLAGCDIPGMGPDPRIAQREAEAKAIGSACRYGLRSIEDCYDLYENSSKAAIFSGWKEMDEYMRDNKIAGIRAADQAPPAEEILDDKKSEPKTGEKTSDAKPPSKAATP